MTVRDPKGNPLTATGSAARMWNGSAAESGDYRIDVTRMTPGPPPEVE